MDSNDPATTHLATVTTVSAFLRVGHQSTCVLNEKDDPRLYACVYCAITVMTLSQNVCQVAGINTLQPDPINSSVDHISTGVVECSE